MSVISNTTTISISAISAPSWASSLALNTWTSLTNANTFMSVANPNIGQYKNGPEYVFLAWGSAALATGRGVHGSMIHWNGGHVDYWGNEVYSFDLSTLTWSRLNSCSPYFASTVADGVFPDNTPAVPHNYHLVGYASSVNKFYTMRRETTHGGGGGYYGAPSLFDLTTPANGWFNSSQQMTVQSGWDSDGTCWDSNRNVAWLLRGAGPAQLGRYSPSADTWTNFSPGGNFPPGQIAYCPTKDCINFFPANGVTPLVYNAASPGTAGVTMSGVASLPNMDAGMVVWSNNLASYVCKTNTGTAIYKLTPPAGAFTDTWSVSQIPVTGSLSRASAQTYGKFQVAEWGTYTIGIMNDQPSGNVQVIKLAS